MDTNGRESKMFTVFSLQALTEAFLAASPRGEGVEGIALVPRGAKISRSRSIATLISRFPLSRFHAVGLASALYFKLRAPH